MLSCRPQNHEAQEELLSNRMNLVRLDGKFY